MGLATHWPEASSCATTFDTCVPIGEHPQQIRRQSRTVAAEQSGSHRRHLQGHDQDVPSPAVMLTALSCRILRGVTIDFREVLLATVRSRTRKFLR